MADRGRRRPGSGARRGGGAAALNPAFFAHPARALLIAGTMLVLVAMLAVAIPTGPLAVDTWWSELVADGQSARLDRLAMAFNDLGRGILRALTIGAIGLGLVAMRRWAGLLAFACTEALTPLVGNLLKAIVDRPRPPDAALTATGSSFPSGHAAYAAATIVAVILLYNGSRRHRRLWIVLGCLAAAGMAWSRTYLQVHWLSDVLAGACLGAATAIAVFAVTQLVVTRAAGAPG